MECPLKPWVPQYEELLKLRQQSLLTTVLRGLYGDTVADINAFNNFKASLGDKQPKAHTAAKVIQLRRDRGGAADPIQM